jgi:hypothetical protein
MFDLVHAPSVVAARLPRLWWEAMGGNPFGPRESERMVTEKLMAFHEGWFGMQVEALKAAVTIGGAVSRLEPVLAASMQAAHQIVSAGLDPSARRVRRNARRLTGF